jgi:hypothetical protein
MRLLMSAVILAAATAVAVPASAQGTGSSSSTKRPKPAAQAPKPKTKKPPVGIRAFFVIDAEMMSASQSFKAVTGSSTLVGYGGGGELLNVWRNLFVRGAVSVQPKSGKRAFVVDGVAISTGIGIDIRVRTTEIGAGWRTPFKKHPKYALFYGGGVLFANYTETSQFQTSADPVVNNSFTGYSVQGGLDAQLSKRIYAAVEAQYRGVPNAFDANGVAGAYGETNLGGFAIRAMIGIKLKK